MLKALITPGITRRKYPPKKLLKEIENYIFNLLMLSYILGYNHILERYRKTFADIPPDIFQSSEEALEFFRQLAEMPADEFYALEVKARQKAFTASRLTGIKAIKRLKQAIERALKEGYTLQGLIQEFNKDEILRAAGVGILNAWYWETVVRTNAIKAYNAGRIKALHRVKKAVKALQYIAIDDERTTELCNYLDDTIKPVDSPFWRKWTPPNHFNCRSTVRPIFKHTPEADQIKSYTKIDENKLTKLEGYQPDFAVSPAFDWFKMPKKAIEEIAEIFNPEVPPEEAEKVYNTPPATPQELLERTPPKLQDVLEQKLNIAVRDKEVAQQVEEALKQVDDNIRKYLKEFGGFSDQEADKILKVYRQILRSIPEVKVKKLSPGTGAYYDPLTHKIVLNSISVKNPQKAAVNLMHELTHAAQRIYGREKHVSRGILEFNTPEIWEKWRQMKINWFKKHFREIIDYEVERLKARGEKKRFINTFLKRADIYEKLFTEFDWAGRYLDDLDNQYSMFTLYLKDLGIGRLEAKNALLSIGRLLKEYGLWSRDYGMINPVEFETVLVEHSLGYHDVINAKFKELYQQWFDFVYKEFPKEYMDYLLKEEL